MHSIKKNGRQGNRKTHTFHFIVKLTHFKLHIEQPANMHTRLKLASKYIIFPFGGNALDFGWVLRCQNFFCKSFHIGRCRLDVFVNGQAWSGLVTIKYIDIQAEPHITDIADYNKIANTKYGLYDLSVLYYNCAQNVLYYITYTVCTHLFEV